MAKKEKKPKVNKSDIVIPIREALAVGDLFTKLSGLIMGLGNIVRKQFIQGVLFLIAEVSYIFFMITFGIEAIGNLFTLGSETQKEVFNEATQLFEYTQGDNSQLCLLYGVMTFFVTGLFVVLWKASIRSAYLGQLDVKKKGKAKSFKKTIAELFDGKLHNTLLVFPTMGIILFTVMPLVFMMLMAFTNYDRNHLPPKNLFDWVGFSNFSRVLKFGGDLGRTFWPVLGWTVIWAIFATGLNYILGMILAMVINRKDTKLKKMWRFIFALSIAVPQFVSLLVVNTMIQEQGVINLILRELFNIGPLPFLRDATWARVTVIIVNLWIGIPYTMISTTGILQNIPAELYESAKVDGASQFIIFIKITLPYMLFVMTPNLITAFVSNINNFNVIFLLTNGEPATDLYYKGTAGKTDLLITWLYKLTIDNKDYNLGAVIGILTFIILATTSLIAYRSTKSYKNEEEFS